ncbi:Uncharacterised protein [[Clostridium] sordellii]|uniref:Uncharacterized protein n=1 Tax=Paraclostridium sordellii TaxID=1505 RepID=A0ABP1XTC7_PARSO|nr:hypothetical protein [Paeniclostridium sordellii]CEJ74616.1 hypothetical protein ATCC9714_25041 [[Clostridium] sordellii] [Paeniclostridium sordellii]CEN70190.1 Uncharacterised protein [[Clostridium] sordellii] [Paeniclostridium sordellii]CEN73480.1 Uncharacterised protein [[Clostridium] sordellii] [Paeniclostridium sordellii]CEO28014.1 Uncharacterised protein [[Clostridium] sordellii] [Paeniclostridium sordellii]CEP65542.1 Uncharacterised protein [[Clostridium] sordellii] [Paeniclostridium
MKRKVVISWGIVLGLVLFIGLMKKDLILNMLKPSREIVIGYPDENHPEDMLNIEKMLNDYKDQHKIDLFDALLYNAKDIENINLDPKKMDVQIMINSPRECIGLMELRLWFKDDICLIGNRVGENFDEIRLKKLDKESTKTLKEVIGYKK